ncbi:hypothetical protein [Brevundimonas sp. FT23028]|uniref:hypothetical protein n=1 Tax=Brevundimonas sp. FT23028 TaxID=3393748 RepID=UPI003B587EC4
MRHGIFASLCLLVACSPAQEEQAPPPTAAIAVSANDLTYCDLVEQEVTPRDCWLAAHASAQAAEGLATLSYPHFMTLNEPSSVRLVLDRKPPASIRPVDEETAEQAGTAARDAAEVAAKASGPANGHDHVRETDGDLFDLPEPEPEPEVIVTYHPIVGRFTSARLEGTDFDISPREPVTKEVPRYGQTGWDWTLTPKRKGNLTFLVVTNVQFRRTDGTYLALEQRAEPYKVTVGVGILSRIRATLEAAPGWIKAVTAILVALTALFGAWFALRKAIRNQGTESAAPDDAAGD